MHIHVFIYWFIHFLGLRWWIYMFVKWAALPLPKFIKWAYPPPPCRQIWGDKTRNILWTVDKFSWLSFFILENLIENTFSSRVVEGRNKDKLTCLSIWNSQRELKCANFVGRSLANFIIMRECTDMPLFQIWIAEQNMLHTVPSKIGQTKQHWILITSGIQIGYQTS